VEGDLGRFTRAAIYIAENDIGPSAPETWKPYATALQQAAEQGRHAKSIEAAAAAVGQLGARCADCHRALGGPKFTLGEPPVQRAGVDAHMDRHQWAADRMWDGLIASATPVWIKGAEVMADARLTAEQVAPETPDIDAIARRVHFQANAARLLPEQQWGKAYGEFIATCALCHEKTGVAGRAEKPAK
jgi:cytochrome c553